MSSKEVKDRVRDKVERGFDKLHRIADVITSPIAPLDGAIHGAARGILNWAIDKHPEDNDNYHNHNYNNGPPGPPQPPPNYSPQPPPYYPPPPQPGYPSSNNFSGAPPNYYLQPPQPQPGYPSSNNFSGAPPNYPPQPPQPQPGYNNNFSEANIHGNKTNAENNEGNDNGAIKFGNIGS